MNKAQALNAVADAVAGLAEHADVRQLMAGHLTGSVSDADWARLEAAKDVVVLRLLRMGAWGAR